MAASEIEIEKEKEKPSSKGQAWFCTTGLPSDIVIEVDDMAFHLHKFPLMSKSRKLHELITEQETNQKPNPSSAITEGEESTPKQGDEDDDDDGEIEEIHCHITLPEFPGGSDAFEMAAKFCYGVKLDLNASTVAALRCAGEYLEMTEEYSEDNLISKAERFLSQSVLRSIKESVKTLKSCERLMPMAETLGITQRCIDTITSRASAADPSLFGWPVNDGAKDGAVRRQNGVRGGANGGDSWFEDLTSLSLSFFKRLILEMRARDLNPEIIENCLIHYAKRSIPGISRSNRKPSSSTVASEAEQREILETIISNLPIEKTSNSSTATRVLFGMLRTANILNSSETCRSALEKKIGTQLEQATLDDLLIPSYSYLNETLYDVDCVERILGYFLAGIEERVTNSGGIEEAEDGRNGSARSPELMVVGKLIDGYLSEIASDANLKPEKFYKLAISLPEQGRLFDDGLYRAVDVYLKAHPWLSEADREKICGVIDSQKLTLEACTHAAQNERLPLRAVVQVLFFEQLQLRHAIAGTLLAAAAGGGGGGGRRSGLRLENQSEEEEEAGALAVASSPAGHGENGGAWREAVRENQVLRLDMDSMRTRVHQLERECSNMKKVIEKIDKEGTRGSRGWSLSKTLGCKFKTQVCDSHEPTVVEGRRVRNRNHRKRD